MMSNHDIFGTIAAGVVGATGIILALGVGRLLGGAFRKK